MGAGRKGESKFVNTMQWKHHTRFSCTDIVWVEIKTLKKHAMPMFSNKLCWLSGFYHAIGSFWMVEDGLVRTDSHAGIETFLFPYLHHLKNT